MRKYWKIILFSAVIISSVGGYYIQQTMAASTNDVSFTIETTSGNKEEVNNLVFGAIYQSSDIFREIYISNDDTTGWVMNSFIEDFLNSQGPYVLRQITKEHRNFMRGKELHPNQYFEDESRLIYTTVLNDSKETRKGESVVFQIDILDKNQNDSTSFKINTPNQTSSAWINVEDVYVENGKIKLLTTHFFENGAEELHIYSIDENKRELETDSIISKSGSEGRSVNDIRLFNDFSTFQNEKYYLYADHDIPQYGNVENEINIGNIYLYNNSSNEAEEWEIPADLKPNSELMILHGEAIFIPVFSANGIELHRYNIEKKKWEEPLSFNYQSKFNEEELPFLKLSDERLYLVNPVSDGNALIIGDLRTGELLYEGKITRENSDHLETDYSLIIQQLYSTN